MSLRRATRFGWSLIALILCSRGASARGEDRREVLCEDSPDRAESSLLVRFVESESSALRVPIVVGREIAAAIILDTREGGIHGWSYGLTHDDRYLEIDVEDCTGEGAYLCDTDADRLHQAPWFNVSTAVARTEEAPAGFVSAVVMSFIEPVTLPDG